MGAPPFTTPIAASHSPIIRDAATASHTTGIQRALEVWAFPFRSSTKSPAIPRATVTVAVCEVIYFSNTRGFWQMATGLSRVQEKAVQEFQCKHLVERRRVVPVSIEIASHDSFDPVSLEIRSRLRSLVEEHFPHVSGEGIAVPNSEM